MGKIQQIRNLTLKKQFIWNFAFIILSSLIVSMLTYGTYVFFLGNGLILPSNYYEQRIPAIIDYIDKKGEAILNVAEKVELEQRIPLKGIQYSVLNSSYNQVYGSIQSIDKNDKEAVLSGEKRRMQGQKITLYKYITSENKIKGAVILKYALKPTAVNPKYNYLVPPDFIIFLSPFIYIIFFTWLFSREFSRNVNKPIEDLINASKKIRKRDLNFTIDYNAPNELGELSQSFEDMRRELSFSLNKQWEIEQERKEMVTAIAHELRTPLTIIKGHVEVLQECSINDEERLKKYLDILGENTDRVIKLIEDMNTLSKIERMDFRLNPCPSDIVDFINKKSEDYSILCAKKNIEFNILIEDKRDNNDLMNIDTDRISQVLDNIIYNSFRFTPDDGNITLDVQIENSKVSFQEKDSGKGFPTKELKNLFKKFYQGDSINPKEKGHSGLGLYIAKYIVEKHGGNITANNNKDGGACITFNINEL